MSLQQEAMRQIEQIYQDDIAPALFDSIGEDVLLYRPIAGTEENTTAQDNPFANTRKNELSVKYAPPVECKAIFIKSESNLIPLDFGDGYNSEQEESRKCYLSTRNVPKYSFISYKRDWTNEQEVEEEYMIYRSELIQQNPTIETIHYLVTFRENEGGDV